MEDGDEDEVLLVEVGEEALQVEDGEELMEEEEGRSWRCKTVARTAARCSWKTRN
jgi:hypothetical protein